MKALHKALMKAITTKRKPASSINNNLYAETERYLFFETFNYE